MSAAPFDIWREILLRLPAESLFRLRAVCKRWRAVVDDPRFVKSHTDNQLSSNNTVLLRNSTGPPSYPLYYFELGDLNFTSSPQTIPATPLALSRTGLLRLQSSPLPECNGLMLFDPYYTEMVRQGRAIWFPAGIWEIWNVSTGERLKLPDPNLNRRQVLGMGIGYDRVADDYKVVVIDYDGVSTRRTHVYSLKSDSWRTTGDCPFGFRATKEIRLGVFLNGALHWMLSDEIIMAFDLAAENYLKLAMPKAGLQETPKGMWLQALGGCLFFSCKKTGHFDAWVMNEYAAGDSWIKLFSLEVEHKYYDLISVAYMKSKKRVLLKHCSGFFWFDFESNSMKTVDIHGFYSDEHFSAQTCIRSLVRLHDTCGRVASETRTMKRATMIKADTKLTFCVRDYEGTALGNVSSSHDDCYNIDSSRYNSSCKADRIHAHSSNPESDSSVPLDILREMLLHLPAKSLIRFRAVCKAFRDIMDEPCFVRAHTNNQSSANTIIIRNSSGPPFYPLYSFDLDALNCTAGLQPILTSPLNFMRTGSLRRPASMCNGLILVADKNWEIWNPLTNECLPIPRGECKTVMFIGLGYDYTSDDYKVVAVDRCPFLQPGEYGYRTHVYSLRSDSWKMIGNFPLDYDWWGTIGPGVFLCGALHWSLFRVNKIIALDLGTESYRQLQFPPPPNIVTIVDEERSVDVLGGCLVVTDHVITPDGEKDYLDVWVMKEYGAENSWTKMSSINNPCSHEEGLKPLAYMKNTSQIFMQDGKDLFLYDVESGSMKKSISIHGLTKSSYARPFSGSIFRLHDNCGRSGSGSGSIITTQRTRKRKREMEISDAELLICVRDPRSFYESETHDDCYILDSNWCSSTSSDED